MDYMREINAFYDWLETNTLSANAVLTWHALMHTNNKCFWKKEFAVAQSVLALKTGGVSGRSIERARNELSQKGLVTWQRRSGCQSALYAMIPIARHRDAQPVAQPVAQSVAQPVAQSVAIPPYSTESLKTNTDTNTKESAAEKPRSTGPDARFEAFWAAYPRRVGKEAARKAYARRKPSPELHRRMMDAVALQRQSEQWQKQNGQFIPNPATWLQQGRWEDDAQPAPGRCPGRASIPEQQYEQRYYDPADDGPSQRALDAIRAGNY